MNTFTIHRRWAAIPLDLLLNPTASLAAKVLAAFLYHLEEGRHQMDGISNSLNLTDDELSAALTELETLGIITFNESSGCYNVCPY